jgi:hypothetical protein
VTGPGRIGVPGSGRAPGDFAVCRIGGAGGLAIGLGQWLNGAAAFARWEHALIYLGDGLCLQAEPGGAQIIARPVQPGDLWSTGLPQFELSTMQKLRVKREGLRLRGVGYSALDYLALAARRLHLPDAAVWPGPAHRVSLRRYIEASGHQICSQLVDHLRLRVGSHLFTDGRWEGYVTPWDIGLLLEQAGATEVGQ